MLTTIISPLREDLAFRRIDSGMRGLEAHGPVLAGLDPGQKDAAVLVGCVAQWVDIGFGGPELLRHLWRKSWWRSATCQPR